MRYLACLFALLTGLAIAAEPVEPPYVELFRQALIEDAAKYGKTCSAKVEDIQAEGVVASTRCEDAPNICYWFLDEDGYNLIECQPNPDYSPEPKTKSDLTADKDSA